jgi:hypothetical protein
VFGQHKTVSIVKTVCEGHSICAGTSCNRIVVYCLLVPGVDVMITIFLQFLTIFGKQIGVFLKTQCYDQNFAWFTFVLSQKRQFFAEFFGENIFKIITLVPGLKFLIAKSSRYPESVLKVNKLSLRFFVAKHSWVNYPMRWNSETDICGLLMLCREAGHQPNDQRLRFL